MNLNHLNLQYLNYWWEQAGSIPLAAVEVESLQGKRPQAGQVRVLDAGCTIASL